MAKTVIYQLKPADKEQIGVTAIPGFLPVQFPDFSNYSVASWLPSDKDLQEKLLPGDVYFIGTDLMPSKFDYWLGDRIVSSW